MSKRGLGGCLELVEGFVRFVFIRIVSKKKGENMKEEKNNTLDGRWRKANRS